MSMWPEEQDEALAGIEGWAWRKYTYIGQSSCSDSERVSLRFVNVQAGKTRDYIIEDTSDKGPVKGKYGFPKYTEDLNAVHRVEEKLNVNQMSAYADALDKICVPVHICPLTHWHSVICSTAHQRTESLCRVLWPERWA